MKYCLALLYLFGIGLLGSEVCNGKVYYVSKNGSNANACAKAVNPATSKLTIAAGIACLAAGDTLYIRAGVYAETLNEYSVTFPSGASWKAPVTIAGYPGEKVTIQPSRGATEVIRLMGTPGTQYLVFDNLILDGVNGTDNCVKITYTGNNESRCANHIRIQRTEIKNSSGNGIYVDHGSVGNEFINLDIHHNGSSDFYHGLYITGSGNVVEKCRIYQNAGWGIHLYYDSFANVDNNVVRNNLVYQNARLGSRGAGIILASGNGNQAYNNIIWGNSGGIQVDYGANGALVYNNTVYANNGGNQEGAIGIWIGSAAKNTAVKNNISWANLAGNVQNNGVASVIANGLSVSPLFVDEQARNFHLQQGSPAIDIGADLSAIFNVDFDGVRRPQGKAYDAGAYEYSVNKPDTIPPVPVPVDTGSVTPPDTIPSDTLVNVPDTSENRLKEIVVFPNPTNGLLYVRLPAGVFPEFRLVNLLGIVVFSLKMSKPFLEIHLEWLPKSIYIYEFRLDGRRMKRGKLILNTS